MSVFLRGLGSVIGPKSYKSKWNRDFCFKPPSPSFWAVEAFFICRKEARGLFALR